MGWKSEILAAVDDFVRVANIAGVPVKRLDLRVEFLAAPHKPPSGLPTGKMAAYGFHFRGDWLKIGIAGPNSSARHSSQHDNPGSARSNLAASLVRDPTMVAAGFDSQTVARWIEDRVDRVNVLLEKRPGLLVLRLLQAFLHVRLRLRYEG